MDYTQQPLLFKLRKTARYVRLYGLRRTLIKVKGQYHSHRSFETLPAERTERQGRHVGIIGCGNFAFSHIAYYLRKNYGPVIRGVMDPKLQKAASLFEEFDADYYTTDPQRVIDDPSIDLIFIASNHASHAEYAIQALDAGKSVHIEKPHVVRDDQLERLVDAMRRSKGRVTLGFNRPGSRIGREIHKQLDSQSGAAMFNWFIAGHAIAPDHWYFRPEEGGRVLGNLCHWTDFVLRLVPDADRYPIRITPTRAEKSDCDIAVTYVFGDGSIAAITFSAKGHTFEGVRERFAAHRGNVLIAMDDFQTLTVENIDRKKTTKSLFRDHGHQAAIRASYQLVRNADGALNPGATPEYVWETGELFLRTKDALEQNEVITLQRRPASTL
ncbi:MAG TPA: Gfo/Idh/MocA family oxidoreductase [Thermoanaerobaculia bacterium]|jgi:predicted dehydrogenase|nr:Gfo/Idh/MocA family oxidoreductase [Thermoanaerobaculia bacterium]